MGARTGREAEKEEGATAVGRSVTKGLLDLFVPHLPHGHSQQRRLPPADVEAGSPAGHPSRQSVVLLSMGLVIYRCNKIGRRASSASKLQTLGGAAAALYRSQSHLTVSVTIACQAIQIFGQFLQCDSTVGRRTDGNQSRQFCECRRGVQLGK